MNSHNNLAMERTNGTHQLVSKVFILSRKYINEVEQQQLSLIVSVAGFASKTIIMHIFTQTVSNNSAHAVTVVDILDECVSSVGAVSLPLAAVAAVARTLVGFAFPFSSSSAPSSLGSDAVSCETAEASAL